MNRHLEERNRRLIDLGSLALTGFALVVEPVSGVGALFGRVASLASGRLGGVQQDKLFAKTDSLEERVTALEESGLETRRIRGAALKVLVASLETEMAEPFAWADADHVMDRFDLSPEEYGEAAEELDALGVVTADPNINHPSGYARTRLEPVEFLNVAPALVHHIDVSEELVAILQSLAESEQWRVRSTAVLEQTGLPVGRFDLYVRALEELELINGTGSGSREYGSFLDLEITILGKRVLRGDDELRFG